MKFEIEKIEIKANPDRNLNLSEWTIEEPQELIAMYGIGVERALVREWMYPNGVPWYIKLLWFIQDCWYKVTGR